MCQRNPITATTFLFSLFSSAVTYGGPNASFQGIGDLQGGTGSSFGFAISGNGLVIVGSSTSDSGTQAFRWTQAGGMVGLGDLPGGEYGSGASETSADGGVVVGGSFSANADIGQYEAFRWSAATGMVAMGDLPLSQFRSTAHGVSANGSVIVGQGASLAAGFNRTEAFRWTQAGGMVGLGDLAGGLFWSRAMAVSADGATVACAGSTDIGFEPFIWTSAGGVVSLGAGPGNYVAGPPFDISADGTTIVGHGTDFSTGQILAYRWISGSGFTLLGDLPGGSVHSIAYSASSDGSVVVGESMTQADREAFIWNANSGMQNLRNLLSSLGVNMTGWTLRSAEGVSDNGRVITGWATNPSGRSEAWIATLPVDGDGDGYLPPADCDDGDSSIHPDVTDVPDDGIDQDCNGFDTVTCFVDADTDGFGSNSTTLSATGGCDAAGVSDNNLDCDDSDSDRFPGHAEIPYDGIDQDCDDLDVTDVDSDGFDSVAAGGTDCDDNDPDTYPGAPETADDGIDQDCNGSDTVTCFVDADTDGFGSGATLLSDDGGCAEAGESDNDLDCDDGDSDRFPGNAEIPYDGIDQDCDNLDLTDVDSDGFDALSAGGTDCDDRNPTVHPSAEEVCDGLDNDCNEQIDEGFADADTDGVTDCVDDDRDGDGVANELDGCPDDAAKTDPGTAGCGNPEPSPADSTDQDGVSDMVEDGAPNGGDGNNDGIPDSSQDNVTSLPNVNGDYLTIVAPAGMYLTEVSSGANPDPATAPPGIVFPAGFVIFTVSGLEPGASVQIQIIAHLAPGTILDTYWKHGPSPDEGAPHWFEFQFDGTTGAQFSGQTVSLTLVDGQRGDSDLSANGTIVDPGAPATMSTDNGSPSPVGQPVGCCAQGTLSTIGLVLPAVLIECRRNRKRGKAANGL
ncbi:MAG: hypothetical protein IT419_16240 [Planctomycetes bacterium]|jgi:probable HAF family extracellular repeat protein|nr:hypothetical protein [Planctomycetota bacterium]OQY99043.1 MAG: hypothetical protein B6D36_16750 [Planctomycetes bacterium UTPLA1]